MSEDIYELLGIIIRYRRIELGITQRHIAVAVGLSRTSIANIEAGRQKLALHNAIQLSKLMHIDLMNLKQEAKGYRKLELKRVERLRASLTKRLEYLG